MKKLSLFFNVRRSIIAGLLFLGVSTSQAQTNVYDNVIAVSPDHTSLAAAIQQAGLVGALQNPSATLTVFAPDNASFDALAAALGTNISGLLASPDLSNILLYHVLGTTVPASAVTNGAIVTPLNTANTIKMTKTSAGSVYANQAKVNAADLTTNNGVVHSIDAVLLPVETVADIAIDNGFTSLVTAVVTAELLPAVTDPLADLTVFAPTNAAFDQLATDLGTNLAGVLANPALAAILTYHVLGSGVESSAINNGDIVTPLNNANTLKLTKTTTGSVFVNQAQVTLADLNADNGIVHVIDEVVLPVETVADVAIDNGFTTLTAAVVKAELLPALSNPFGTFTVFAPTNAAFDNLATALGTDLNGILNLPNLADVLLYHVVGSVALSTDLTNGAIPTLLGQDVTIDLTNGVKVNDANVTTADVTADNGVVHVIDAVLLPSANLNENMNEVIALYPNPATEFLKIDGSSYNTYAIVDLAGKTVKSANVENQIVDLSGVNPGIYTIQLMDGNGVKTARFMKQ
jgi:transforming growth factor-beta-induced protein